MSSIEKDSEMQKVTDNPEKTGKKEDVLSASEVRQAVDGAGMREEQVAVVMEELESRGIKVMTEQDPDESELLSIEHDVLADHGGKNGEPAFPEDQDQFEKTMSAGIPVDDPVQLPGLAALISDDLLLQEVIG